MERCMIVTMGSCCSKATTKPNDDLRRAERLPRSKQNSSRLRNNLLHQTASEHPLYKYEIVHQLGIGSMGSVSSVRLKRIKNKPHGADKLYAMKSVRLGRMSRDAARELLNEIRIVSDLDHPGIVKFYDVYYEGNRQIYIVMELCR